MPSTILGSRLLYVMASQCYATGRIEEAVRYCDTGQIVLGREPDALPYGVEGMLGGAYIIIGQPWRWVECVPRRDRTAPRPQCQHPGMSGFRPGVCRFWRGGDGCH